MNIFTYLRLILCEVSKKILQTKMLNHHHISPTGTHQQSDGNKWGIISFIFIIKEIPTLLMSHDYQIRLGLFGGFVQYIDWAGYIYETYITQVLLAYIILFKIKIPKGIPLFIYIISLMDLIHLILFGGNGFGLFKLITSLLLAYFIGKR